MLIISCSAWEPLNKYSPGGKCERCCYGEILFQGTVRTMILLHIPERNYMPYKLKSPRPHPPHPESITFHFVLLKCFNGLPLQEIGQSRKCVHGRDCGHPPSNINFLEVEIQPRANSRACMTSIFLFSIPFLLGVDTLEIILKTASR